MATDKITLKNWFKTGLTPLQAQFHAWIDSYWHKDEKIPITAIEDIEDILDGKMDLVNGKVPPDQLDIINDFTTGGATKIASAETVKVLKSQLDSISTLLTSDNVTLDTIQELVDAIEVFQNTADTILINDLTTGGVGMALTAEMGKVLKNLIDGKQDVSNVVVNNIVNGTYNIDWNNETYDLVLNGNTTFTESNLPPPGFTKVISIYVSGAFALTLPANWATNIIGTYSTTKINQLVIEYRGVGKYWLTINQGQ
jgi:hypothetical protein